MSLSYGAIMQPTTRTLRDPVRVTCPHGGSPFLYQPKKGWEEEKARLAQLQVEGKYKLKSFDLNQAPTPGPQSGLLGLVRTRGLTQFMQSKHKAHSTQITFKMALDGLKSIFQF